MAQILALLSLLKTLMSKELSSFSSLRFNNFLFCILFLMLGGNPKEAFSGYIFLSDNSPRPCAGYLFCGCTA